MKISKDFDCIQMKREASLRIHEEIKNLTREEELAYWRAQFEDMRREYPRMKFVASTDSRDTVAG